jgi:hypothetical protein
LPTPNKQRIHLNALESDFEVLSRRFLPTRVSIYRSRVAAITIDLAIRLEVRYLRAPYAEQAGGGVQDKPVTRQSLDIVAVPAAVKQKSNWGMPAGFASLALI